MHTDPVEGVSKFGPQVKWYPDLRDIPRGFTFFLANEFFDALPIHQVSSDLHLTSEALSPRACFSLVCPRPWALARGPCGCPGRYARSWPEICQVQREDSEYSADQSKWNQRLRGDISQIRSHHPIHVRPNQIRRWLCSHHWLRPQWNWSRHSESVQATPGPWSVTGARFEHSIYTQDHIYSMIFLICRHSWPDSWRRL